MNEQYFGDTMNTPDMVGRIDKDSDTPIVNLDPFDNRAPVDASLIHETPLGETVAAVSLMDDTIVYEAPVVEAMPYQPPRSETITHENPTGTNGGSSVALLNREESDHFRTRWNEIQGMFVDEPRSAVQQADALVSEVVEHITQMFATEHSSLEGQWKQGNDVSTEDLRKALQRYLSWLVYL
jgi:hypothetical protein